MGKLTAIDLRALNEGMPGLSSVVGGSLAEAAAVCLEEQSHPETCKMSLSGHRKRKLQVTRDKVTEQARRTWNDAPEATEQGACAIAISIAKELEGLNVVQRAAKGTGFDYWLGKQEDLLFQETVRLEVSGIRNATKVEFNSRIKQKKKQTKQSDSTALKALIAVVDFGIPKTGIAWRGAESH